MGYDSNDIESIKGYLDGTLNTEERSRFEAQMESDLEFAEKVVRFQCAFEAIQEEAWRLELNKIHEDTIGTKKSADRVWPYLGGIAAVLVLGLFLFLHKTNTVTNEELFQSYFEPYPNILDTRTATSGTKSDAFFEAYSTQKFNEAGAILKSMQVHEINDDIRFYGALTFLILSQPKEAETMFHHLHSSDYYQQVRWYLALTYIKNNEIQLARKHLLLIGLREYKYKDAQKLLHILD